MGTPPDVFPSVYTIFCTGTTGFLRFDLRRPCPFIRIYEDISIIAYKQHNLLVPLGSGCGYTVKNNMQYEVYRMEKLMMGKRICEARKARGWTQETLAERADIGTMYLREIERGIKAPGMKVFIKLLNALEIVESRSPGLAVKCCRSGLASFEKTGIIEPEFVKQARNGRI